jgi:DNA-binding beta-propeller fold protein YncE
MTTRLATLLLIAASSTGATQAPVYTVDKFNLGGTGGTHYPAADPGTSRVFVPHDGRVMVVDAMSGGVIGEVAGTPGVRGVAIALRSGRGFTTNAGDSTVTMFDPKTLAVLKNIKIPSGGLNRITYDPIADRVILTNHGRPTGSAVILDPGEGTVLGSVKLEDATPEGAAFDDRGRIFVANRTKRTVQVFDVKTFKVLASWPIPSCESPSGIAADLRTNRVFVACNKKSVALDGATGKVVASFTNGDEVDGLVWDGAEFLMYIPSGKSGNISVVRMVSPNSYKVVATIPTLPGAKTLAYDLSKKYVFVFHAPTFLKISH